MQDKQFIKDAIRTESPNFFQPNIRILHAAIGCVTESGELLDSLKKQILQWMRDNRIEIVEVVKGAEEKQVKYKQLSDMPNAIYGYAERIIVTGKQIGRAHV